MARRKPPPGPTRFLVSARYVEKDRSRGKWLDDLDRTAPKNQRIHDEIAMAAKVRKERSDLVTKRAVAKEVARRLGRRSHRTIETRIPKK